MANTQEQRGEGAESRVNIFLPVSASGAIDTNLVERIVAALYNNPWTSAAIVAAGGGPATATPRYITSAELKGLPPPRGALFYNEAIGVLSVPAPDEGGVQAVEAVLQGFGETIRVEPEVTYRAL